MADNNTFNAALALGCAVLLGVGPALPARGQAPALPSAAARSSRLVGTVRADDGKTGVPSAVVHAHHLASGMTFSSKPTNSKGAFEIGGLPFGYFDLAVETPDGLFLATPTISLAPAAKAPVVLTLRRYEDAELPAPAERVGFPGLRGDATGTARTLPRKSAREFWRSRKGVIILAGVGAAVLLTIAASDEEDQRQSTNTP
jgi:hypothetical protein